MADAGHEHEATVTRLTGQSTLTDAGLAGRVTFVAGCRPLVFIVSCRASLQALAPWPHEDVARPTAHAVLVPRPPALAAGRVASLTNHVAVVSKVTV